jgi:site-specific DNA-methyltransferase (cytosine-N4-specific)
MLALANTESNSSYQKYCREHGLKEHPARFPSGIPEFFIKMLTDPGDVVFDPFAGSCVTGEVCEQMHRKWVCCEIEADYVKGAVGRFKGYQGKLFPNTNGSKRIEPYIIYPPNSLQINEDYIPLIDDGGKKRPKIDYDIKRDKS